MKAKFVLAGMMAVAMGSAQAGTYRWVDSSGKVHYGDEPPATEGVQVEQKRFGLIPETDNANLSYETRRAQKDFPVTLYMSNDCGKACQQARDFLNKRGIPFSEKILLTQQEIDDFIKQSGSDQSPTLQVGKVYIKSLELERWNSELDIAGYPRTAPYRPQSAMPAAGSKPADAVKPEEPQSPQDNTGAAQ